MLIRLPISLAQLKAGNSSENLKNESGNYCILCTDQKNLQKTSIKVWLTLFKHGNNLINTENSKTDESNKFI